MLHFENELPNAFLTDCLIAAIEDSVAPFREQDEREVGAWLDAKKKTICDEFHVHLEETGRQLWNQERASLFRPRGSRRGKGGSKRERDGGVWDGRILEDDEGMEDVEEGEDDEYMSFDEDAQKLLEREAGARMRYLMEPLPHRKRY